MAFYKLDMERRVHTEGSPVMLPRTSDAIPPTQQGQSGRFRANTIGKKALGVCLQCGCEGIGQTV